MPVRVRISAPALLALCTVATAFAATTEVARAGAGEVLPDLVAVPPYDIRIGGDADRFVVGFGSTSQNIGEAQLEIRGEREDVRVQRMRADQIVGLSDGSERVYTGVGTFAYVTEETHLHWHWLGFMRYELRRASDYALANPDVKSGFCVADRQRVEGYSTAAGFPDPSWCEQDNPTATELRVGMSVGWGDPYEALIEGQEIEVSGVAAGEYYIVHRVNPKRLLQESDYSNNFSASLVELSWPNGQRAEPRVRELLRCELTGTPSSDRLGSGQQASATMCGLGGNDRIHGGLAGSMLDGGPGSDTVDYSAAGVELDVNLRTSQVESDLGGDRLRSIENVTGGTRDDVLRGSTKRNRLSGGPGHDTVTGGRGKDVLRGGVGRDVLDGGSGRDQIRGGQGNDRISSSDGARDAVSCGAGYDYVEADRRDRVAKDCESVTFA